jgi:hypothetical protein
VNGSANRAHPIINVRKMKLPSMLVNTMLSYHIIGHFGGAGAVYLAQTVERRCVE